ncbi:hypothetical protein [Bacteroides sp.]|uniref:hypothetical protein n=1 Tax=Bacteroides sp. TaxID=29523 RepID=UPI00262AD792|nr:hypothetical protein [Bacteroides sp.]MDD3038876.1 hypothetical protein [Bacteroides sp.]
MDLQVMTKSQLIEKVEELSANLDKSTINGEELKAKVFEDEKIIGELRVENGSLKNEVNVQKESTEMYRGWWSLEKEKNCSILDKLKSIAVLTDCVVNSVKN